MTKETAAEKNAPAPKTNLMVRCIKSIRGTGHRETARSAETWESLTKETYTLSPYALTC